MNDGQVVVNAEYEMKSVSAKLNLTYVINNKGAVKVTQKMTADAQAKVAPMFRFGMQLQMPKSFETIEYYGRGPIENYIDRNHSADLGLYVTILLIWDCIVRVWMISSIPIFVRRKLVQKPTFVGGNS